jgi:hypothetical protein
VRRGLGTGHATLDDPRRQVNAALHEHRFVVDQNAER